VSVNFRNTQQVLWTDSFMNRVLFNASKAYVKQLNKSQKYKYLQPVYFLNFIDDTFDADPSVFYHHYKIVNIENTGKQIKGLEFVFVELPKFKPQRLEQKKLQVLWLRYLTEISDSTTDISHDLLTDPEVREAIEYLQVSAFTKSELEAYDKYWDQIRVERTIREDSHLKGREEGKQIGLQEGVQIGLLKGEQTGLFKTALRMLRKNISTAEISEMTGLDNETLQKLSLMLKKYSSETENHLDELC
jgi:predicted transposase/invertase (TIGR01784 family)